MAGGGWEPTASNIEALTGQRLVVHQGGADRLIAFQHKGWIGVDIGTRAVKLAQVVRRGDRARLHYGIVVQRGASWTDRDDVVSATPVSSFREIYAGLHSSKLFSGRSTACVLPINACQLRGLTLPSGSDRERRAMVSAELANEWLEQASRMSFDYWELTAGKDVNETKGANLATLSTTKEWVTQVIEDCRRAGLDCWALDGVPLTIARAVSLVTKLGPSERVLALDWGYSNATLCVVGDHRPLYSRRLSNCGFRNLLDKVGSALGVTLEEAQYLVDRIGLLDPAEEDSSDKEVQSAICDAASVALEELAGEMHRTIRYLEVQRSNLLPNALWLLGGGASMRNLASFVQQAVGLPTHVWKMPHETAGGAPPLPFKTVLLSNAAALSALPWGL